MYCWNLPEKYKQFKQLQQAVDLADPIICLPSSPIQPSE